MSGYATLKATLPGPAHPPPSTLVERAGVGNAMYGLEHPSTVAAA